MTDDVRNLRLLRPDDPRAVTWLAARDRQGSVQAGWRPCAHAPTAWVTEPDGTTWCEVCSDPEAAVLRWLRHGPLTVWRIAVELGWDSRAVYRALRGLLERGLVEDRPVAFGDRVVPVWGVT